jgi:hypothetical protein
MNKPIDADLHNFGRSVQKVGRASGTYYQKPRPIYWERLFFGVDSPLSPYFKKAGQEFEPRHALFNIETEIGEDFCGFSREIAEARTFGVHRDHFYSFGVLLAYCYAFGIRDLHRHNLIRTPSHLQVVDAEIVLVKLLLPNETLLLPFKEIGPDLASVSHLQAEGDLSEESCRQIFSGYFDTFECLRANRENILGEFTLRMDEMRRVPIRHILRDTPHYRRWQNEQPEDPFFEAELSQLRRGDIPYFFKFLGDEKLYSYANSEGSFEAVETPESFQRAIDRDAVLPSFLFSEDRVETLFPTGALFLAKKLISKTQTRPFVIGPWELHVGEKRVSLSDGSRRYEAAR